MDTTDPRTLLRDAPMSAMQIRVVAITVCLNALDGFDVLAISFASPGIAEQWGIDRAALGFVLSMELIGMGFGSVAIGRLADLLGRQRTIIACLCLMTLGMWMATTAADVYSLSAWRVLTGVGIGGILASISATAAEFANARRRDLCVALMAIGYPVGAVVGGSIAAVLLREHDWRSVFYLGAAATALFIPLVWLFVPDSAAWLIEQRPGDTLGRLNRLLARMGHAAVTAVPAARPAPARAPLLAVFAPGLAISTLLVTVAYLFHVTTFYYVFKWIPKIVVDMGYSAAAAAEVLVWTNVGGASGGIVLGLLAHRLGLFRITAFTLLASPLLLWLFGRGASDLTRLTLVCATTGFFINAGVVGLYGVFARVFPARVRASGTGFAIGMGRGGSVLAPIVAGLLFAAGANLLSVSLIMATGSALAAAALLALMRLRPRLS